MDARVKPAHDVYDRNSMSNPDPSFLRWRQIPGGVWVLGFVSLYLMQSVVRRVYGRAAGWFFVAAVAGLSSFGIYLGRFLRFNSWDVLVNPVKLYYSINAWAADPLVTSNSFAFPVLFATFSFITYVLLYALTHLPQTHLGVSPKTATTVKA